MDRKIIATAAFFGMTAVILGAFGAHKLKELLTPTMLASFETGVRYQMYHALLLLFMGTATSIGPRAKKAIFWLVTIGIVLFSGSIYLLSTGTITGIDIKPMGWITPIGGVLMIAAWAILIGDFMRKKS